MDFPERVTVICDYLISNDLKPMVVGGAVIDLIQGREPKDWDIEVYGSSLDDLQSVLESAGYHPKTAGKEFGILIVGDMDISVPRRDNKTGKGHKDFKVEFDPFMSPEDGARRRDFTINSMYYDMELQEVIDPFGGLQDLEDGILRAIDPEKFIEDPLRALRAMQLLARKAKTVESNTMALIRGMVAEFPELAEERVYEEFRKLLMRAEKPSIGFEFLRESGWIVHFPELEAMIGCKQHPTWHSEGSVWIHTLRVIDAAAQLKDKLPEDWRVAYMFAAMLHDIGKPATTTPDMHAYGHDTEGGPMAAAFMKRMRAGKEMTAKVAAIVGNHMQPFQLSDGGAKTSAWKKLHNKCRLDVMGYMSHADRTGTKLGRTVEDENPRLDLCLEYFDKFGEEPIPAVLMGRHLIEAGLKPGPQFKEILARAYEAQLEDSDLTVEQLFYVAIAN